MGEKGKTKLFRAGNWPQIIMGTFSAALVAFLLVFELGSLVPGASITEVGAVVHSQSIQAFLANPFNAQHVLAQYAVGHSITVSVLSMRLVSVALALITAGLFFYVVKSWYTLRVAIMATLLFATSAWFLHTARLATPLILQLSLIGAMAYGVWLRRTRSKTLAVMLGILLVIWLVYIPGFIWFVLIAAIWQRKTLSHLMQRAPIWGVMAAYVLGVALLAPMIRSFILHPELLRTLAGLPSNTWPSVLDVLKNIASVPKELFVHGPNNPEVWLGGLPLLDFFSMAMLALGSYSLYFRKNQNSVRMLAGGIIIGTLLVGFGVVNVVILLPLLYVIIGVGITLMLQQWFTVFPRNPLARTLGSVMVVILVALTIFYNINHYFIAWPNAEPTKQVFTSEIN